MNKLLFPCVICSTGRRLCKTSNYHFMQNIRNFNIFRRKVNIRDKETVDLIRSFLKSGKLRTGLKGLKVGSLIGSVCFICYQGWVYSDSLTRQVHDTDTAVIDKDDPYIILDEPLRQEFEDVFPNTLASKMKYKFEKTQSQLFPFLQSKSNDPAILLKLTQSSYPRVRHVGLRAITAPHRNWGDAEYRKISQACSDRTMISMARIEGADYRLFRPMPWQPQPKSSIEDGLRTLLASLPKDGVDPCIPYYTAKALLEAQPKNIVEIGQSCNGVTPLEFAKSLGDNPDGMLEQYCLQALIYHSQMGSQCVKIVELGGLMLLHRVYLQYSHNIIVRRLIARILSNIALNHNLHKHIVDGGWVAVLHRWLESTDTALYFHTARALANLDRDWESGVHVAAVYDDGIYLAHPINRSRGRRHDIKADIVFIHGLLGGPFKTWRQEDRRDSEPDFVVTEEIKKSHTFFWPKDWLVEDLHHHHVRMLNVGFHTELSMWKSDCPLETEKRTLAERGALMIDKLYRAGVGNRPVIWVGHSMGGLLIKEILHSSVSDPRYIKLKENTVGTLFYGTPHRGSTLARTVKSNLAYPLYISVEVQELDCDNPYLDTLQKSFQQFITHNNIPCLSFGENYKTDIAMNRKIHIVPSQTADPGVGQFHAIDTNHINVCKPKDKHSYLYVETLAFIRKCLVKTQVKQFIKQHIPGPSKES